MKSPNSLFSVALVLAFLLLLLPTQGVAQHRAGQLHTTGKRKRAAPEKPLALDLAVRTGKLANGFTYYIRRNATPKNQVLLYLVNKVGSILEDDDQRGLAHFMEHMNFNGTTHFPKNELVNYLQKAGVRFGADINAYTGFDETVYQLPLPADQPEVLQNGFEIMHDWAQGALLDPAEMDKERGVVLEEKRLGKGAQERMQRQYLPLLLNHSRYGQRLPIGVDTVLENFPPATLRRFYHDWYRPDLQALLVVGDIDVARLEALVKVKFADLKNPAPEKARPHYTIPLTGTNQFIAVSDRELTSSSIQVLTKHVGLTVKTASDYRHYLAQELFNSMLSGRYSELSNQANPPFIAARGIVGRFLGGLDTYGFTVVAKPGELESGFKAAWREGERVRRAGFTQPELDRARKQSLNGLRQAHENADKTNSAVYVNDYLNHFLRQEAAPGVEAEYRLGVKCLAGIDLAMVNGLARQYLTATNQDVIVLTPAKDRATAPDSPQVAGWMRAVQQEKLPPYVDDRAGQPLTSASPIPGKIVAEVALEGLKATELTLSNGARVILKPTDFQNNAVLFQAGSPGGASLYGDAEFQSAITAAYLTTTSGLGTFTYGQFSKYVTEREMGLGLQINENSEGIQGFATRQSLPDLLQAVNLFFTAPKIDSSAYKNYLAVSKAALANRSASPSNVFTDTVAAVLGGYSPRKTGPSLEKLSQIDLNRAHAIFQERFADAADFTFTLVGDFDPAQVKPLLEKYLASLPATHSHEQARNLHLYAPAGQLTKTVYKGLEPRASVSLVFSGPYTYGAENNRVLDALAEVLQIRLLERLREEESGVYSPSARVSHTKIPDPRYAFTLNFSCAPQHVAQLIASALDEVNKMRVNGPAERDIDKFKAENRLNRAKQLRENYFWAEYFMNQSLTNESLTQVLAYDTILGHVTKQTIQAAATEYLSGKNLIRLVLMPETGSARQ